MNECRLFPYQFPHPINPPPALQEPHALSFPSPPGMRFLPGRAFAISSRGLVCGGKQKNIDLLLYDSPPAPYLVPMIPYDPPPLTLMPEIATRHASLPTPSQRSFQCNAHRLLHLGIPKVTHNEVNRKRTREKNERMKGPRPVGPLGGRREEMEAKHLTGCSIARKPRKKITRDGTKWDRKRAYNQHSFALRHPSNAHKSL